MTTTPVTGRTRDLVIAIDKLVLAFSRHWLLVVNVMARLFIWPDSRHFVADGPGPGGAGLGAVPFLRPELPPITPAVVLPVRPARGDTYPLEQIMAWGGNPGYLRGFVGNAEIGFKMARAHRNTVIYTAVFLSVVMLLPEPEDGGHGHGSEANP